MAEGQFMQRLSAAARWIGVSVLLPILIPLAVHFIEQQPPETAGAVLKFLLNLAEQTWLRVIALVLGGFVAGLWLDWLLRKFDGSRAEARENLGIEMEKIGRDMREEMNSGRTVLLRASPRLNSCFTKARKVGLWVPDARIMKAQPLLINRIEYLLVEYLLHVGTLLSDGHFKEAKREASQHKDAFAAVVAENEKEKREQAAAG
jgi:hypothetical protein